MLIYLLLSQYPFFFLESNSPQDERSLKGRILSTMISRKGPANSKIFLLSKS